MRLLVNPTSPRSLYKMAFCLSRRIFVKKKDQDIKKKESAMYAEEESLDSSSGERLDDCMVCTSAGVPLSFGRKSMFGDDSMFGYDYD